MESLHPEALTWTALLGRWVDFARASLALPDDAEGERWRAAVPAVINLQAVTFALGDLAQLPAEERPHARDKAELLIRDAAGGLEAAWRGEPMPASLMEISADATAALEASRYAGAVELRWPGPGTMVMPAVPVDGVIGTLTVMQPGTIVMPAEPVAWWVDRDGAPIVEALPDCTTDEPALPRQVYRQIGEDGRIERDVIAPITAEPAAGLPLLVPLYEEGRAIGHFTLDAEQWLAQQCAAMADETIPVAVLSSDAD